MPGTSCKQIDKVSMRTKTDKRSALNKVGEVSKANKQQLQLPHVPAKKKFVEHEHGLKLKWATQQLQKVKQGEIQIDEETPACHSNCPIHPDLKLDKYNMSAIWNQNEPRCVPREGTRTKTLKRSKLSAKINSEVNKGEEIIPFNSGVKRIENLIEHTALNTSVQNNDSFKPNDFFRRQETLTPALTLDSSTRLIVSQMAQSTTTGNRITPNKISNYVDPAPIDKQCAMLVSEADQHRQVLGKLKATIAQKRMIRGEEPIQLTENQCPAHLDKIPNILMTKMRWKPMAKGSRQRLPPLVTKPLAGPPSLEGQSFQPNAMLTVSVAGAKGLDLMPQPQINTAKKIRIDEQGTTHQMRKGNQLDINGTTGKNELMVSNNEQFWQDVDEILAEADLDKNVFDKYITETDENKVITGKAEGTEGHSDEGMKLKLIEGSIEDIPNDFTKRLKAIVPTVTADGKRGLKIFVMGGQGGMQQRVSTPKSRIIVNRKPCKNCNLVNLTCDTMEEKIEHKKKLQVEIKPVEVTAEDVLPVKSKFQRGIIAMQRANEIAQSDMFNTGGNTMKLVNLHHD